MIGISSAKAYTSLNPDCEAKGTCLLLCNYNNVSYVSNSKTSKYTDNISIYYFYNSNQYSIYWTRDGENITNKGKRSFNNTFGNAGKNVYLAGLALSEDDFSCPVYGYVDNGNYQGNELCFDNDGVSCASSQFSNDANTKFGSAYDLFVSAKKDYDIYEDIDIYYNDSAYRDFKCEEIFDFSNPDSGKLLITKEDFNADVWKDFNDNYLHGRTGPTFIEKYQQDRSNSLFNNIKNNRTAECKEEAEKLYQNGNISSDEYNNRNKSMDNVNWANVEKDIDDAYSEYLAGIRYVSDVVGNSGNVVIDNVAGLDFCSQNGVKQVMHIIGLIIFFAKITVPLILVIMGTLDFYQSIKDPDSKGMKDQLLKFVKRILAAIIIFFIPTIVNFIFSLVDNAMNYTNNFSDCSDCVFKPFNDTCIYYKMGE